MADNSKYVVVDRKSLEEIDALAHNLVVQMADSALLPGVRQVGSGRHAKQVLTLPRSAAAAGAAASVHLYKVTGGSGGAYTIELYNEKTDDATKKIGTGTLMYLMKHISDNVPTDGKQWGVCVPKQCSVLNITPA